MGDFNKKVSNPLFNNAVTGGTLEDFSHALLLPAKEKPPPIQPPPVLDLSPDTQSEFVEESLETYQPEFTEPQSNLSSVFSSFSNILKINPNPSPVTEDIIAPPAGIESILDAPQTQAPPIPLFTPTSFHSTCKPPEVSTNSFRRTTLKKPVYAPVPGLSNPIPPPVSHFKPIAPQPSTPQNFLTPMESQPEISNPVESLPVTNGPNQIYRPVYHHWFFKKEIEGKVIWQPFSMMDSLALDTGFTSNDLDPDKFVATDGGRYDVNILRRQRTPVYWKGEASEVRRCSWFHKSNIDGRCVPYEENIATKLEEEYKLSFESSQWHRKIELLNGETVVFHSADVLVLFPQAQSPDAWGNTPNQVRPKVVKRGMDEFDIDEGEPATVDHLLFLVHGIGSVCDLKFRSVEEVVDEFRSISFQLVQSHYKSSCERGVANRVEVLPISWHQELHSEDTGIDRKLKSITLESIPRLRDFTNDTLLDILFYTSPIYCQTIISTVGNQLNKMYELFQSRNPDFRGGVSLGGHSLGSLILFDLLCHQVPSEESQVEVLSDDDNVTSLPVKPPPLQRRMSKRISYMMGVKGTGQPQINYPNLVFQPKAFFALGSPIGMFVTVRGLDTLGEQFVLPTCPAFFNIFHPYDPVAYRIESLVNPELAKLKPVLIPHHKGRKRMHLELKETMARVGADLKQRIVDSMKNTWNSFYQFTSFHRPDQKSLEEEVDLALNEQMRKTQASEMEEPEQTPTDLALGLLNNNRRIDYVLQEAPFEIFNEYLFALTSHVCYWDSEDTMLMMLKEIYDGMNVTADDKIPQQTMTIERPPSSPKAVRSNDIGMDPTVPIQSGTNLGPPPITGFVKKT